MKSDEKIIDRVRKLRAQAESAAKIGSENEAQAFAALMQRMMVEHKIRESDLKEKKQKPEPVVEKWWDGRVSNDPSRPEKVNHGNRVEWVEKLAGVVAHAHYCRIMVRSGLPNLMNWSEKDRKILCASVCFVGRRSDAETALIAFETMLDAASALGRKEYFKAYDDHLKGKASWQRGFYRSYLLGFASRLRERYEEELGKIDDELKAKQLETSETKQIGGETGSCTALAVIAKDAFDAVDEHFELRRSKGELGSARAIGVGVSNLDAYGRGKAAADRIKLRPDKKLGSGPKGVLT